MALRKRLKVLLQLGEELHVGRALRLGAGRLLIDVGVALTQQALVTIYTFPTRDGDVERLGDAEVAVSCEDIMVPADAEFRYLAVLTLLASEAHDRIDVRLPVPGRGWRWPRRRRPPTHDGALLDATFSG